MTSPEAKRYALDLLKSPEIQEIFQAIENRYTEVWKGSPLKDSEIRDDAYRMVRAISELRTELASIAKGDEIKAYNSRLASSSKMR